MKIKDLELGHFYSTQGEPETGNDKNVPWNMYVYFADDGNYDFIGKYGKTDNVVAMNSIHRDKTREYKELPLTHPVFSEIGAVRYKGNF